MHATGISAVDRTVESTIGWVDDVCESMGDPDRAHGWVALRAVLQHLRDVVDTDEARQIASQLPMLLRGLFYEGWNPKRVLPPERTREVFLDEVLLGLGTDRVDPEAAARAVFRVLSQRLGPEAAQARARLARGVRDLWPEGGDRLE